VFRPVYWDAFDTSHALDNPFPGNPATVDYVSRDGSVGVGTISTPPPLNTGFVFGAAPPSVLVLNQPRIVLYY
jgi:hypothetical protein